MVLRKGLGLCATDPPSYSISPRTSPLYPQNNVNQNQKSTLNWSNHISGTRASYDFGLRNARWKQARQTISPRQTGTTLAAMFAPP